MLSLLRWGLGSGNEHLTEKESITAVAKHNSRAALAANMPSTQIKRKRGNSTLSHSLAAHQRPAKRSTVSQTDAVHLAGAYHPIPTAHLPRAPGDPDGTLGAGAQPVVAPPSTMDWERESGGTNVVDLISGTESSAAETKGSGQAPTAVAAPEVAVDADAVRQAVESEFCLEILLKHKELRLIDQEIAKCQVALEQLRRCALIPYPASTSDVGDMLNVSGGVGMSLRRHAGNRAPASPAPWGAAEGPYTRHYARWLLPDPEFDGGVAEESRFGTRGGAGGKSLPERHTRGSKGDYFAATAPKLRAQRGLAGSRLHALPAGYPEPKEEKGPMIVKRASDAKFVKLVCIDCKRENFNSAQGFINHCRIAHGRGFASHEAAAQACGQEVEPAEPGSAPITDAAAAAAGPTGSAAPVALGLVHPLIRSSANIPALSMPAPRQQQQQQQQQDNKKHLLPPHPALPLPPLPAPVAKRQPADRYSHLPFVPSPNTPHLSKLFAKSGRGGDLGTFVADATVREDLNAAIVDDGGESASGTDSDFEMGDAPSQHAHAASSARLPSRGGLRAGRAGMSPTPGDRPHSRKGIDRAVRQPAVFPAAAPLQPTRSDTLPSLASSTPIFGNRSQRSTTLELLSETPPHDLSPHTVESNNAPSLVSDSSEDSDSDDADDDYETGNGTSIPDSDAGGGDDRTGDEGRMDVDFEIEDVVRGRGGGHHAHHHHHHVGGEDVGAAGKSDDPELMASGKAKAKVNARRGLGGGGPRKAADGRGKGTGDENQKGGRRRE